MYYGAVCNGAQSKDIAFLAGICIIYALINECILAKRTAKVNLLRLAVSLSAPYCATLQVVIANEVYAVYRERTTLLGNHIALTGVLCTYNANTTVNINISLCDQ